MSKIQGTLENVHITKAVSGGSWGKADLTVDGQVYRGVSLPPDKELPEAGGSVNLSPNKKYPDTYIFTGSSNRKSGGASKSSGGAASSSDYWAEKYDYEVNNRDPKIEYQFYVSKAIEAAGCAISNGLPLVGKVKATSASDIFIWSLDTARGFIDSKDNEVGVKNTSNEELLASEMPEIKKVEAAFDYDLGV